MHRRPIWLRALDLRAGLGREERRYQSHLGHPWRQWPGKPSQARPTQVVTDRRRGGPYRLGHRPMGTAALRVQPQHFLNLAQG
jgi:hypothetical protein